MTPPFSYSILQYRHSLLLGEAINVGVLFQFPTAGKLEFVAGNAHRLKAIYPDFDLIVYNYLIKSVEKKVKEEDSSLFRYSNVQSDFKQFLHRSILPEDATVLQFQDPVSVLGQDLPGDPEEAVQKIVEEFSKLLLPGIIAKKKEAGKHNESFLIRRLTEYITRKNKELEKNFVRNKVIKTEVNGSSIELRFDLAWKNGSLNLIKPLSFDLGDEKAIQDKSAVNYGYLNLLGEYAKVNNYRFDILVSKPQNIELVKHYDNAIGLLNLSDAPKRIITENDLDRYSEETSEYLSKN